LIDYDNSKAIQDCEIVKLVVVNLQQNCSSRITDSRSHLDIANPRIRAQYFADTHLCSHTYTRLHFF